MKLRDTYRKIPDTVRYGVVAVLLWAVAVLFQYAPENWQGFSGVISGLCLAVGLILVFFIIQRFLSERFNQAAMLQRMHAHMLHGRLTVIDAQLSSFNEKLDILCYPQDYRNFAFLGNQLPPLGNAAWLASLEDLLEKSRMNREERTNFRKAFDGLAELKAEWDRFNGQPPIEPSALMDWQKRLRSLVEAILDPLRKVLWHIEA